MHIMARNLFKVSLKGVALHLLCKENFKFYNCKQHLLAFIYHILKILQAYKQR